MKNSTGGFLLSGSTTQFPPCFILSSARYHMLNSPSMVLGLDISWQELNLEYFVVVLSEDPWPIDFSNDPITKMHDSLPIVLFPFDVLMKL
jgi:hypothetical protein